MLMVVSVVMMKSVRLVHGGGGGRPDGHRVRGGGGGGHCGRLREGVARW